MATTTIIVTFSTIMNNHFDEINANFNKLNTHLDNIERARSKVNAKNDIHKVLDHWTRKFNEFFDGCNNSPSITDPIQPENNTP